MVAQAAPDSNRSVQARCQALGLARSSFYYQPCGESAYNPDLMRLLDEEFTDHNFKGWACATTCVWPATPSMPCACATSCA